MKRLLLIMVAFLVVANATAQETDSLQTIHNASEIEKLTAQLEQLQKDYDYLHCDYEITKISNELKIFQNDLNIKSNALLVSFYNNQLTYSVYSSYKENYDACVSLLEAYRNKADAIKYFVSKKIQYSNFDGSEIDLLNRGCNILDQQLSAVDSALNYYQTVLNFYFYS